MTDQKHTIGDVVMFKGTRGRVVNDRDGGNGRSLLVILDGHRETWFPEDTPSLKSFGGN